ncbi:MFS transporter [Aureimonas frigidaquae]|uniref:MFS transporter n=1 Tax=Aureimonas frigidaquae TaxID=424757 RepID=UPI000A958C2E|nr:MFS transporter [Aureimonas frigidaquae]
MLSADRPGSRLATRLSFLVAGFVIACWAPLVPFAKTRLGVDDATLGLLLLCIGLGSVAAMLATGPMSARYGSRPVILVGGFGLAVLLPILAVADTPLTLGLALLAFGASLGSIDVAMNIHAVEVEKAAGTPLMSGFHALFSIGGFLGATLMTLLLSAAMGVLAATMLASAAMALAMIVAWPGLLSSAQAGEGPLFALPRGIVLLLAALAAITFLVEGAVLDWSALLITEAGLVETAQGGLGYMLFAIAMTAGRLVGDAVTARLGDRRTILFGGIAAVLGLGVVLAAPAAWLSLAGFVLVGLGASNIVPVLFRLAGSQKAMPSGLAVAAITTVGYAGILVGPAGIGFVAQHVGLATSFWLLAGLLLVVPLCARAATTSNT